MDDKLWPLTLQGAVTLIIVLLFCVIVLALLFIPIELSERTGTILTTLTAVLIAKLITIVDSLFITRKTNGDK